MVPRLKISNISPKEKYSSTYLISTTSLPEDEQTSKHGGGGRYNAVLECKGANKKKERKKQRKKKSEYKEKRKNEKRKKIYEYV
jgi:hypothetical protein